MDNEALNEIGLKNIIGNILVGNLNIGFIILSMKSKNPLEINIVEENIIANIDGNIEIDVFMPSLHPIIKDSYVLHFFILYKIIENIIIGNI